MTNAETLDQFTALAAWNWWSGKIEPSIFLAYDTRNTWSTSFRCKYTMSPNWYLLVDQLAFLGDREWLAYWRKIL